jgi:hypothetical protein
MSTELIQDDGIKAMSIGDGPPPTPEPPEPPTIGIDSPADGAKVVGSVPGITVVLSGSGWTPHVSPAVKVKIGATDTFHNATVSAPNIRGDYFWTYTGVTVAGGPITVTAQASIGTGADTLTATDTLQLAVNDVPPVLNVDDPSEGKLYTGTESGAVITVLGRATSVFGFGPNAITWNRDNGQATGTTQVVNDNWTAQIQVPKDTHSLKFTATDILGNSTSVTRSVIVTVPTAILDVSLISYLQALIKFATDPFNGARSRITTDVGQNLTIDNLVQKFFQKFQQLPTFSAKANEPLHQIRLCIEVLRGYFASLPSNPPLAAALSVQEGRYRQAAYFALLNQLGTSFDEIRTLPTAQDKRKAIADRLGISLGPSRPDNLDALFLDPTAPPADPKALTEQKLEALFGLVNTTRDPLQPDLIAAFLGWRLEDLLHEWRDRDFPLVPIANALPIIDPDLLIQGDFKNPVLSDPAFNLFKTRQGTVQAWVVELQNKRVGATALAALNAMLTTVLQKLATDMVTMDDDQKLGKDISAVLSGMKLDLPAFNYLARVSRILLGSASATLLESEWTDVVNILVQVRKKRKFVDWRNEEKAANPNLSLSPNYFQSPTAIPFIRSTGTDANGALVPEGTIDPNWTITAKPGGVTGSFPAFATKPDALWFPNRNSSRWISSKADATLGDSPGNYTYRTSFDLTGFDPTTVQIRMQISVDDELVDVKLNNQSLGLKIPVGGGIPFRLSHGMQISSGFVAGINTLEFIVNNANTIINPTAIQAQLEFASVRRLPFPTWRATAQARQEWESTLNGRIEQEKSVKGGYRKVIDAVEEANLPLLRNALVAGTGKDADWLTQRLLIDVKADSKVQTTRLNQAIETVQSLFFGLRNSDPPFELGLWKLNRDSVPETNSLFDEQWNAIGSYDGWRAAMLVFLYPENLLRPTLRPAIQLSPAFTAFLKAVRAATPLTRDAVVKAIADYLTAVRAANPGLIPPAPFTITEQLSEAQLLQFATQNSQLWAGKTDAQKRVLTEVFFDLPITLALQFQQSGDFETALAWYRIVYALELPPGDVSLTDPREFRRIFPGLTAEKTTPNNYSQTSQWLLDGAVNPHQFATQRANAYTRFTLLSIVSCMLSFADSEFTTDSFESLPRARSLYINAREVLDMPELSQPPTDQRVKMNPVIAALRGRAEVNLFKLRSQRNIAGMQREVASLNAQPASMVLTGASSNGRALSAGAPLAPTQYRYATLIERAKQLVTIAQQIEASFLASLEKRDAEAYSILRARQDLDLSTAHITLQDLRVAEAADGVLLAELQQDKSQFSVDHYQGLIQNDLSGFEIASMACLGTQVALQTIASTQAVIAAGGTAILSFLTFGLTAPEALSKGAEAAQMAGTAAGMQAGMFDKMAGYERRKQDWQFQRDVAVRDTMLSDQQHQIALDQQQVVLQEQAIANTQQQQALATVNFLATKFTNVELYEYMSGILQEVYSFFLQQASAMARLAQNQLAFERQETTLSFIQADYWQGPANGTGNQNNPDRRGMTGSARLLQDIFELDQHAFATDQRKLQLTKTISLAQMAPFEFQRFRETGVLPVATTRQLFDQDFPGHYLRLIKRVRTCVLALIPPTQGIKATLSNTGVSRTTIGGSAFQDVVVRRDPQAVALTSPMNATGLFELDAQPELLLPFEGLGVETSWEFQMPKAANFINYDSIADVLITIEYTALSDAVYRNQVIQQLNREFNADRAISFQQHMPDSWYDLHNPEQIEVARRFRAEFSTAETDFPLNLERDSLKTSNLLVYFVPKDGEVVKVTNIGLSFVPEGAPPNTTPVGGDASSDRGLLSTRSGSAGNWGSCLGVAPFGRWTLDLSRDAALQALLAADKVRDILFVLSYSGSTPAWPI